MLRPVNSLQDIPKSADRRYNCRAKLEREVMSHVVEAVYENGGLKLEQPLPLKDLERVRVTVESLARKPHSVLDIRPVSLGQALKPPGDDDLLGEMLEGAADDSWA